MGSNTVIGIPTDDKVFEENCVPLFAGLLNDRNVKLLGTSGKAQFGLDLLGRRDRDANAPVGIQCKLVTRGAKLTEAQVRAEVRAALTITPPLTEFYIVTTARDDPALDFLAIALSQEQSKLGRTIDIQVWGWDTLQEKIRADPKALNAFDPNYSASTDRLLSLGSEILDVQMGLATQSQNIANSIEAIRHAVSVAPVDTARSAALEAHLDRQVDEYRSLMISGKPATARRLLETLETSLDSGSSASIRARVRSNIAFASLKLGEEAKGARLLEEAYVLNPGDPKTRANRILAMATTGDLSGAWAFANEVLEEEPDNTGAAAYAFQVAALHGGDLDPMAIVPEASLDELAVRIHRMGFLRTREDTDWRGLAAETFERFPDDGVATRFAGEALLESAFDQQVMDPRSNLPTAKRVDLVKGAELTQRHWDEVRRWENAGERDWLIVGLNLLTAYRALNDWDQAGRTADQLLALNSDDPDISLAVAQFEIDRDRFPDAIRLLRTGRESPARTIALLVALSNSGDWGGALDLATAARRETLDENEREIFDVMRFRAGHSCQPGFDLDAEIQTLLSAWPDSIAALIAVIEIFNKDRPEEVGSLTAKAMSLVTEDTSFPERLMLAQMSYFREAWDDIITLLDGRVSPQTASPPLLWLALAFANAPSRPRTSAFFKSLDAKVIGQARYARLAGAAEHNRGDLRAAEAYLRQAVTADPRDLRAHLLLASALERDNRFSDAVEFLRSVNDEALDGTPEDFLRLAVHHRRAGDADRALKLGYRVVASHRGVEDIVAVYPSLLLMDYGAILPVAPTGPAQTDFWFDLEGVDGANDVSGVIDLEVISGIDTYPPSHPLAQAILGKAVGASVMLSGGIAGSREYRIRTLKHKYIWLFHDIMATHAARFPEATSMGALSLKDGDVQPILNMVRDMSDRGDMIIQVYIDNPVPLAALAAMAHKQVFEIVGQLAETRTTLRACIGAHEERDEAEGFVRQARGQGVVLDSLTIWQLHDMGRLQAAKDYFGRLCIPRSAFDDLIEARGQVERQRGREFITVGYDGDQAWRRVHTVEETESRFDVVNQAIASIEATCEILAVEAPIGREFAELVGQSARLFLDPIDLAREQAMILLSEDLHLRQWAAQKGVKGGAWLQVLFQAMTNDGVLPVADFLRSTSVLGARRHGHLWLDASVMIGILELDDPRAFQMFEDVVHAIGGLTADLASHVSVTLRFMRSIWSSTLPTWQKGRAIGRLLTQWIGSRPDDWRAVFHLIDNDLGVFASRGDDSAAAARVYLLDWIAGHFLDLAAIRNRPQVLQDLKAAQAKRAPDQRGPAGKPKSKKRKARPD